MDHHSKNGNGTILPPTPNKVITGVSLVHRKLSKTQVAVLAANVEDGLTRYVQTNAEVAASFGVSQTYIDKARRLTPEQREAILRGWDTRSLAELMPRRPALVPAPNCASLTNLQLEHVIRIVGIERVLEAAVQVERT